MLAEETEPRDRILLRLLYAAGLRVSEACDLLWRNLHARGDAGQITVFGKNGRTRAIPLPHPLLISFVVNQLVSMGVMVAIFFLFAAGETN